MNPILNNQNSPELVKLLKASNVAYHKAKYWEIRITYFFILLAFTYPVFYVFINDDKVKLLLLGCSFGLNIFIQIFYNTFKGNTTKGAMLKEEFDVELFGIPWKTTHKNVSRKEVSILSTEYNGPKIENWYSINLSENIEKNIAIAVCQHSNTGWDIDLRNKYLVFLKGFLYFYSVGLFIFLVLMNVTALTIFFICFSILSFYTHFFTLIRGHSSVIDKREAISKKLEEIIQKKKRIKIIELRDIQDEIFLTRQESAKVPTFFFKMYKKRLNTEFEDYIESVNRIYA